MNDKHNFAGYIKYLDNEYFCTVNDYVVKMFYKDKPQKYDFKNKDDDAEKYLFGFDEIDCLFAVLALKIEGIPFSFYAPYHFCTPILVKGKPSVSDLSNFDGIEYYGETVNKIFNPRQAVKHSEFSPKVDDISLGFKSHSDYSQKFDININNQKAKIEYLIYRYVSFAEQKNEDGSISLGSLNSAISIKFENPQSLELLKQYYLFFNNFLIFLTGRQNVDFGVKLLYKDESNSFLHTADCFFRKTNSDIYDGQINKTIQINMLGDKFPELFKLFTDKKTAPFLRFLPENNKVSNRISDADVLNICTAFEIAYGLDATEDKDNRVNSMMVPEFKKSILSRRILFLFQKATNIISEDDMKKVKESIASFVILRDNITHNGTIEWGDCAQFSRTLIKILYITILLRAGVDKETSVMIAEKKWGV
jgi:hypothetical protein